MNNYIKIIICQIYISTQIKQDYLMALSTCEIKLDNIK